MKNFYFSTVPKSDDDDDNNAPPSRSRDCTKVDKTENKGKIILDATCIPADIHYPTDIGLLNESRLALEQMIDQLHTQGYTNGKKPRTYRRIAKKSYMNYVRKRRPSRKLLRASIKQQLGYIRRNIIAINTIGDEKLCSKAQEQLSVIYKIYEQQQYMYTNKTHKVTDRIVSLSQPWVRPIVRGKVNANVEFGAKLCISVVDGYMRVEELRWDAYNESTTLQDTVERYRKRTGSYPQKILADKIYRTRKNLSYCKEHNIQLNGPPLGRPLKYKKLYAQLCRQEKLDAGERNEVEGKFGTAKRCYGMSRMSTRLQTTSEADIYMTILTMNLVKKFKAFLGVCK